MISKILLHLCMVALAAVVAPIGQAAPPSFAKVPNYQAFYVFGDSLSDTGNDLIATQSFVPPVPPSESPHRTYYEGRFSNGPVAFEYLWRLVSRPGDTSVSPSLASQSLVGRPAVSFAFGGSGSGGVTTGPGGFDVPGVLAQVEMFRGLLNGSPANMQALYAIWSGANDYIFNGITDPSWVVRNISTAIQTLYSLGARSFLVPNLPDIGLSPFLQARGLGLAFTMLTEAHNAALDAELNKLAAGLPGIGIARVDVYTLTHALVDAGAQPAPALEFIAPGTGAATCLFTIPATCPDVVLSPRITGFLFWDALHPTTKVHESVANAMYKQLTD